MDDPAALKALKALIREAFDDVEYPGNWCLTNTPHGLDAATRNESINSRSYGERTWLDHARHTFAVFDDKQVRAIVSFLRHVRDHGDRAAFERAQIAEALDFYREPRLG